jgi:hypothetical protein
MAPIFMRTPERSGRPDINPLKTGDHTGGNAAFHKVGHSLRSCVCGKGRSFESGGDDGPTPVVEPKRGAALKATVDRHRHNRRQVLPNYSKLFAEFETMTACRSLDFQIEFAHQRAPRRFLDVDVGGIVLRVARQ